MNTCADFYTRPEGELLEDRVARLEQALELLEASFEAHTNQDVYESHNFSPNIILKHEFHDNTLLTTLTFDDIFVDDFADLSDLLISSFGVNINELGNNLYEFEVTINESVDRTQFSFAEPQIDFETYELADNVIGWSLTYNEFQDQGQFEIIFPEATQEKESNLSIDGIHQGDYLYLTVADGQSKDTATIYLDADVINNFNGGGDSVSCEQTEQKIDDCCAELAALINNVSSQLLTTESILSAENQEIKNELTIDIEGETITEFSTDESEPINEITPYTGKGLRGIHELLKTVNSNLFSTYSAVIEQEMVIAAPSWWQVRLGGNVPQICCTFRRVGTRNYHSLTIPHPISTSKPTEALLPSYTKGNIQGMIVCKDNSKFIVNANSAAEAERIGNIARSLIDPAFLPDPFKIWIGERKGEPVNNDQMQPTSIFYYSEGQKHTKPDWRIGL